MRPGYKSRRAAVASDAYRGCMTTPARLLPPCPKCGSTEAVEILYGYPTSEAGMAAERGEIVLGGCLILEQSPAYQCRGCGAPLPWARPEDPDEDFSDGLPFVRVD